MTVAFSLFSNNKSLIGFEIERNGAVRRGEDDSPVFQKTVEISIGFLFGYMSLNFDLGNAISLEKIFNETNDFTKL